jgi:hypothetical protein
MNLTTSLNEMFAGWAFEGARLMPGPMGLRQVMVVHGYLVVHDFLVGLVAVDPLHEGGLIVAIWLLP